MTPKILDIYQKEYEEKKQEKANMADYSSWLNGMYVMEAISSLFSKNVDYPDKPHHLKDMENSLREESPEKFAAMEFSNWAMAYNSAMQKGR